MSNATPMPQSAAERAAAETELDKLVAKFAARDIRLFDTVRRRVLARVPTAHEIVYEYRDCVVVSISPSEHGYEGVFAIRGDAKGVHLYFNAGAALPDPEKLLKGSGKLVRCIDVESAATLEQPAVMTLVDEAIRQSPVKFAKDAQGTIAVRVTTAKKAVTKKPMAKKPAKKVVAKRPVKKRVTKAAKTASKKSAQKTVNKSAAR